ncbi:unnamed protein product, partial [Rotaria magnacalcarata]
FLKQSWGEDKLNRVNALLGARDKTDASATDDDDDAAAAAAAATTSSSTPVDATTVSSSASSSTKAKPKLSKARTMKNTAKVSEIE